MILKLTGNPKQKSINFDKNAFSGLVVPVNEYFWYTYDYLIKSNVNSNANLRETVICDIL